LWLMSLENYQRVPGTRQRSQRPQDCEPHTLLLN
jgi:hypothetical protein